MADQSDQLALATGRNSDGECNQLQIGSPSTLMARAETSWNGYLAEREGFEPPIRLPVCRISSAVHSTARPPLPACGERVGMRGGTDADQGICRSPSPDLASLGRPLPAGGER